MGYQSNIWESWPACRVSQHLLHVTATGERDLLLSLQLLQKKDKQIHSLVCLLLTDRFGFKFGMGSNLCHTRMQILGCEPRASPTLNDSPRKVSSVVTVCGVVGQGGGSQSSESSLLCAAMRNSLTKSKYRAVCHLSSL